MNLTNHTGVPRPLSGQRISSGLLARVDRIHVDGQDFAIKTFRPGSLRAWAREIVSQLTCPQPEVIALSSYGRDKTGAGWLSTPWIDAPNAREFYRQSNAGIPKAARAWIEDFQNRLAAVGFRWTDASMRNLLVLDAEDGNQFPRFAVVDYSITSLARNPGFTDLTNSLLKACGEGNTLAKVRFAHRRTESARVTPGNA